MTADAVGGVWTYAAQLAGALKGADVTLAVLGPAPTPAQRRQAAGARVVETGLSLEWMVQGPGEVAAASAGLRRLVREIGPDIVHLNSPALAAGERLGPPTLGFCHSCVATWWAAVKSGPMPADFRWRTEMTQAGLANCDVLAAPSRSFAAATAEVYGVRPAVACNGARPFGQPSRPREPIVFTAGRLWDEGKNVATLDRAAALSRAPVYAAGALDSPAGGARARLDAALPVGALAPAEVADWMGRAAIFASAALYEPFGLGVLEAAQSGCALVLSDIPTFRELWNGAAWFVGPRDAAGFAAAFDALAADPDEAARLGALARARAARFSAEAMAAATLGLYRQLCPAEAAA
jgi:glycosyltransferase involved in cell wall biosynthesis